MPDEIRQSHAKQYRHVLGFTYNYEEQPLIPLPTDYIAGLLQVEDYDYIDLIEIEVWFPREFCRI